MTESAPTVFVVDDDVSVHRALEWLLRSAGYRVRTFGAARERPCSTTWPASSSTCGCPARNGLDLFETLTAAGREPSVVFITGHGDVSMTVKAMRAGTVAVLPKPFDADPLPEAVARDWCRDARAAGRAHPGGSPSSRGGA